MLLYHRLQVEMAELRRELTLAGEQVELANDQVNAKAQQMIAELGEDDLADFQTRQLKKALTDARLEALAREQSLQVCVMLIILVLIESLGCSK